MFALHHSALICTCIRLQHNDFEVTCMMLVPAALSELQHEVYTVRQVLTITEEVWYTWHLLQLSEKAAC